MQNPIRFHTQSRVWRYVLQMTCTVATLVAISADQQAYAQGSNTNGGMSQSAILSQAQNLATQNPTAFNRLLSSQVPANDPALLLDSNRRSLTEQNARDGNGDDEQLSGNTNKVNTRRPIVRSPLEIDYRRRTDIDLALVGYEYFIDSYSRANQQLTTGSVWDDYVIGIGDEIVFTLRGNRNSSFVVSVDKEGRITLPELAPVNVAGLTFEQMTQQVNQLVSASLPQTQVFLSLGKVRAISVTLAGEVAGPGRLVLSSLSSLTDALAQGGGIRKTGSLRSVRILRGNSSETVDLYPLFVNGGVARAPRLQDGDRIVVDTIGPTVAVVGEVLRPGIYELSRSGNNNVQTVIDLAGGMIRPLGNTITLQRLDPAGRDQTQDLRSLSQKLQSNDIIRIDPGSAESGGFVTVRGAAALPGRRTLSATPTVYALLDGGVNLGPGAFTLLAILETRNARTYSRQYITLNLIDILNRKIDVRLEAGDVLYLFSDADIAFLTSDGVLSTVQGRVAKPAKARSANEQLAGEFVEASGECSSLEYLNAAVARGLVFSTPFDGIIARQETSPVLMCPAIFDQVPDLLLTLINTSATVVGEIRHPRILPVASNTPLAVAIESLGGITQLGDGSYIEMLPGSKGAENSWIRYTIEELSSKNIVFGPGDMVRVARRDDIQRAGYINLRGEIKRPGRYGLRRGEKLSELLARAGGLTTEAYAYGAIFQRNSVQLAERAAFARAAAELRSAVPVALMQRNSPSGNTDPMATLSAIQVLIKEIEDTPAIGRVVIEADPVVLQVRPDADFLLEDGDSLTVPKRPAHVTVSGEVLLPSSVRFVSGLSAQDYIRQAGGINQLADLDRAFILLPNGVAERIEASFLGNSQNTAIPPGSTIIVPRDPAPLDLLGLTRDTLSIVSSFALTAASLAVVARDN